MPIREKLDTVANIALITAACALMVVGVHVYRQSSLPGRPTIRPHVSQIGKKLTIPGVAWHSGSKALILALSTKCHFCAESTPFYQQLAAKAAVDHVALIVMMPQDKSEIVRYLSEKHLDIRVVAQGPLGSINVDATPTVLLVDGAGIITRSWVGRASDDVQRQILGEV